eukprot:6311839-Amphidinium_carterae.1
MQRIHAVFELQWCLVPLLALVAMSFMQTKKSGVSHHHKYSQVSKGQRLDSTFCILSETHVHAWRDMSPLMLVCGDVWLRPVYIRAQWVATQACAIMLMSVIDHGVCPVLASLQDDGDADEELHACCILPQPLRVLDCARGEGLSKLTPRLTYSHRAVLNFGAEASCKNSHVRIHSSPKKDQKELKGSRQTNESLSLTLEKSRTTLASMVHEEAE